jgi:hypothetical protein
MSKGKGRNTLTIFFFLVPLFVMGTAILFVLYLKSQESGLKTNEEIKINETSTNKIDGLPDDFPIFKDSELVTTAVSNNRVGKSFIWLTGDEVGLVYEYLKSELRIRGWNLSDESSLSGSYAISFEKNGIEGFLGVFRGSGGKSVISVSIRGY